MRLVAVETPVAGRAETHRTVRDGDVMRMEPAEIVEVPAGAQVEFAPGGLHIMLMDLKQPLNKRSEEHTSELQSLMRNSYAVFCLKKKTVNKTPNNQHS